MAQTLQAFMLLLCIVLLGSAPVAFAAQGCAVDTPEDSRTFGGSGPPLLTFTGTHHYEAGRPVIQSTGDKYLVFSPSVTLLWVTPYDSLGSSKNTILHGVPTDMEVDLLESLGLTALLGQDDGFVVAVDVATAVEGDSIDLGRTGCSDSVGALALQLKEYSDAGFVTAHNTDVVYAGTKYSSNCTGYNSDNKVYALDASGMNIIWTFNEYETINIDTISGMAVEKSLIAVSSNMQEDRYANQLFVTTESTFDSAQKSVFAINTLNGALNWSVSAGRIQNNPVITSDRLYVASLNGELKAFDKSNGNVLWSLSHFIPFVKDFVAGQLPPYDDLIVLVDYFGDVVLVRDNGSSATVLWTTDLDTGGGETATTSPVIDDLNGYVYVGGSDGKVRQLNIDTGSVIEPMRIVDAGSEDVTALTRFPPIQGDTAPYTFNLYAATNQAEIARYCTPFMYPLGTLTPDGDINADGFVNAIDVLLATKAVLGLELLDPTGFGHGDVAPVISSVPIPNGIFDLGDLLMITRKALLGSF